VGFLVFYFYNLVNGVLFAGLYETSNILFWIKDIANFVVIPGVFIGYIYWRFKFVPADYGLIRGSPAYPTMEIVGASIFAAISFGLIIIPIDYLSNSYFLKLGFEPTGFSYKNVVPDGILKFPVVFYLAITAGLIEEIFYRGIPKQIIFESNNIKYKKLIYILGSSIAFSTIHWTYGIYLLVPTFIFGLFAAWLYLHLKNLWPLVGGHFIYDFYVFW